MGSKPQPASAGDTEGSQQGKGLTVSQQLQAKAALPQLSKVEYAFWVVMAVLAQLNWGLYPVCTRYLQVGRCWSWPYWYCKLRVQCRMLVIYCMWLRMR
jgi:hypothetical protein